MFSNILKNTILVFLIIVIIYFILKNQILDRSKAIITTPNQKKVSFAKVPDIISVAHPERTIKADENMKDLYNYVFEEDAGNDLSKFYEQPEVNADCANDKDKTVNCNPGEFNVKTKELCPTSITKHYELLDKKQSKNGGIVDMGSACMNETVASYEGESVMNGSALVGNVTGFEDFHTSFATL